MTFQLKTPIFPFSPFCSKTTCLKKKFGEMVQQEFRRFVQKVFSAICLFTIVSDVKVRKRCVRIVNVR